MPSSSAVARTWAVHAAPVVGCAAVKRAELADEQLPTSLACPRRCGGKLAADGLPFGRRAPSRAQPFAGVRPPVRALVGERRRQVVVDRHDQAIVVGQLEVGEAGEGVHLGRTDDDVTVGIAVTHDGQSLGEQVVPALAGQPPVRLD